MMRNRKSLDRIATALESRSGNAGAERITSIGDQFRSHMGTLSSVLLGFSLFGFQVESRDGDWFLVAAMLLFGISVSFSTIHGYKMTVWLDNLRKIKSSGARVTYANEKTNKKKWFNRISMYSMFAGLIALVAFAISNAELSL